jgi:hypothetical protein
MGAAAPVQAQPPENLERVRTNRAAIETALEND